jgi:hypothetical protein
MNNTTKYVLIGVGVLALLGIGVFAIASTKKNKGTNEDEELSPPLGLLPPDPSLAPPRRIDDIKLPQESVPRNIEILQPQLQNVDTVLGSIKGNEENKGQIASQRIAKRQAKQDNRAKIKQAKLLKRGKIRLEDLRAL